MKVDNLENMNIYLRLASLVEVVSRTVYFSRRVEVKKIDANDSFI